MNRILTDKVENILGGKKSADRFEECWSRKVVIRNWEGREMEKGWVGGHKSREMLFFNNLLYIFR